MQRHWLAILAIGQLACGSGAALAQSAAAPTWSPTRAAATAPATSADSIAASADEEVQRAQVAARQNLAGEPLLAALDVPCETPAGIACEPPCDVTVAPAAGTPMLFTSDNGYVSLGAPVSAEASSPATWRWRVLPADVAWQSYWGSVHEPRMGMALYHEPDNGLILDATLGGRASLLRYGTEGGNGRRPVGWELQLEGAALPRLNLDRNWDLEAVDFRVGVPLIYAREHWQWKAGYYHLSSHMGDEFAIRETALGQRINYSRDVLVTALSVSPLPAWRWYAEAGWAFYTDGGSKPVEFQFGVDVAQPGQTGAAGTPYLAVNGHLRQEHDFGGNLSVQAGWLWRGPQTKVLRMGLHYFNGKSNQYQFFDQFEQQIGGGLWYDF